LANTSKDELLLGGGIRHITATSQYQMHSNQVPACKVILFKHASFRKYFVSLREKKYLIAAMC